MTTAVSHDPTKKNVLVLALCQALAMSSTSLLMTMAALVGNMVAGDPSLATLPLALQFGAMMVATVPASLLMQRIGRRMGFTVGTILGVAGGLLGMLSIFEANFLLLCFASTLTGAAAAFAMYYRFAAADTASDAFKSKAISLVLAGGVLAAVVGPQLAKETRDLFEPVQFAGGYLAIALLQLAAMGLIQMVAIPHQKPDKASKGGRPMGEIMAQPKFIVAVLSGMVGYGAMNLVMVATPLAMIACNHSFNDAASVIQFHVLGMYAPSFFTGSLIQRFGLKPILATGALLIVATILINISGVEFIHFAVSLVLLGLGWNFLFVGGSTLLTETYREEERARVQAANDLLVFGTVTVTAFSSGALYNAMGWQVVNLSMVLPLVVVLISLFWLSGKQKANATA
ncbi:MFS transporter [Rhodovibrionaceae bacterium A322]